MPISGKPEIGESALSLNLSARSDAKRVSTFAERALSEAAAIVRCLEIEGRTERHDAGRIDLPVAGIIMPLDVGHVHGLGDAGHLIELAQVVRQIWIVDDPPQVALEVADIDGIETDQRGEQAPVPLGQAIAD